jgi:nucleoside-diphosphate-sugar epimerase
MKRPLQGFLTCKALQKVIKSLPMKALVTGGTGFIGSHLVEALLKEGIEVRCLVRDPNKLSWLAGLDVETVKGDCAAPAGLIDAMKGVDYVFHAAGITKAVKPQDYYRVNAEGTKNLLHAATKEAGRIRKFVLVSSQAAAGPSKEGQPRREDDPPEPVSYYGRSKLKAEQYALSAKEELNVAIVRPTAVYGPRDRDILTFFKMVSRGFRTAFSEKRLLSVCYVSDIVEGTVKAALKPTKSGDAFFLAHPLPNDWDGMGEAIASALGVKARRLVIPIPLMGGVALCAEAFSLISGKPALLNRQKMAEIRQRFWVVDTSRAEEVLGFAAHVDFPAGAKITADWYRLHRWL